MKGFFKFAALTITGFALLFVGGWRVADEMQPKLDAAQSAAKVATARADAAENKLAAYKPPECPAVPIPQPKPQPLPTKRKLQPRYLPGQLIYK